MCKREIFKTLSERGRFLKPFPKRGILFAILGSLSFWEKDVFRRVWTFILEIFYHISKSLNFNVGNIIAIFCEVWTFILEIFDLLEKFHIGSFPWIEQLTKESSCFYIFYTCLCTINFLYTFIYIPLIMQYWLFWYNSPSSCIFDFLI